MSKYEKLTEEKLKVLADKDDVDALFETAMRAMENGDLILAKRFFTFSAQLGHAKANAHLGIICEEENDLIGAVEFYKKALSLGEDSVAPSLAKIFMQIDVKEALEILISSSMQGNIESIKDLEDYYESIGNVEAAEKLKGMTNGE